MKDKAKTPVFRLRMQVLHQTEAQATREILTYLRSQNCRCQRNHVGTFVPKRIVRLALQSLVIAVRRGEDPQMDEINRLLNQNTISMGEEGMSDWTILHPEHSAWFLEMKGTNGSLRDDQVTWQEKIRLGGYQVCTSDSARDVAGFYRSVILRAA